MARPLVKLVAIVSAALCIACADEARAQCTTAEAPQRYPVRRVPAFVPGPILASAADAPVWKRIAVGTFAQPLALRNALDRAGCRQGDLAAQALARPVFRVSAQRLNLDLVAVSAADLGVRSATAELADIYTRAERIGLGLAPAEVGPQLRLQYLDQPVGEVLDVGMAPIRTWAGQPVIFVLINGAEGLVLLGQDVAAQPIPATTRFLFVRPAEVATSRWR